MAKPFEIQVVSSAFSGKIPEHLWKTVGRATTPRGAYRVFAKHWAWYHPQQNAWSGHVRVLRNGKQIGFEYDGAIVVEAED